MKIIAFTKQNPKNKHPEEDSFKYFEKNGKIIVAVADGITRDLINGKYPNPSPAKIAADLFCKSFLEKQSFLYCNQRIRELNEKNNPSPDYLKNDFWACVGVGGIIKDYRLSYEFIADCVVAIYNKNGELKIRTENEGPNNKGSIDQDIKKKYNTSFAEEKGRKIIRSKYRNNPKEPLAYGALTGEKNAEYYIRKGEESLEKGDFLLFYTDGIIPIISSKEFNISKEFNDLESYINRNIGKIDGSEGTLVAVRLD